SQYGVPLPFVFFFTSLCHFFFSVFLSHRPVFSQEPCNVAAEISIHSSAYYGLRRICMSARRTLVHLAAKTVMVLGAIFVVTVLLVAMPGHHAPSVYNQGGQSHGAQGPPTPQPPATPSKAMPGMDMGEEKVSERAAVADMTP